MLLLPHRPNLKNAKLSGASTYKSPRQPTRPVPVCLLYNNRQGDMCTFAPDCKYVHACCICHGSHPKLRCPKKSDHYSKGYKQGSPSKEMKKQITTRGLRLQEAKNTCRYLARFLFFLLLCFSTIG